MKWKVFSLDNLKEWNTTENGSTVISRIQIFTKFILNQCDFKVPFVTQLERARVDSRLLDDYRDLIKKGREEFRKEMESVRPEVRIGRRVGMFSSAYRTLIWCHT